jgi:phosphatidylserine/phosphatidylglycerophosphate/cardiolipin synthase-like enzyme
MNRPSSKLFSLILLTGLIISASAYAADFHDAKVADISDRQYEPAIIELLDSASQSIIISMYILNPSTAPVALLVKDLTEALQRGVKVEIYLNTRFQSGNDFELGSYFKALQKAGAVLYLVSSHRRLHDKLIIVDERFVVDGSTNWSVAALKDNYESAVIIDSPEIARQKLTRMRNFLLAGEEENVKRPDRPVVKPELPDILNIPRVFLEEKKYFSRMLTNQDERAITAYLLLIAESTRQDSDEFFLNLEDFAKELRMPASWTDSAKRRQIIKTLKKLNSRYRLIKADFTHGKDAWITLEKLPGAGFVVSSGIFRPGYLAGISSSAKAVLLISALLEDQGVDIEDFPRESLCRRFYIQPRQFHKGLDELRLSIPAF